MILCYEGLLDLNGIHTYCLPYKCDRVNFLKHVKIVNKSGLSHPWHLLGFHDSEELIACGAYLMRNQIFACTFDTAKCLNYATSGLLFNARHTKSGEAKRIDFLQDITYEDQRTYIHNVLELKRTLTRVSWPEVLNAIGPRTDK